jgi:hypothetical protein
MPIFFKALQYGTLRLPRMSRNGAMKSAIGKLQAGIGAPFRDYIVEKSIGLGFMAKPEWPLPGQEAEEKIVGPIDVLIIDHRKKRFLLVEAKNLHHRSSNPKDMKEERDRFLDPKGKYDGGFLSVLNDKEKSFVKNKGWHLHELKLTGVEDYTTEGVIVVNHPMFWPLFAAEPLPILDDLEFLKRLRDEEYLFTVPIKIS